MSLPLIIEEFLSLLLLISIFDLFFKNKFFIFSVILIFTKFEKNDFRPTLLTLTSYK